MQESILKICIYIVWIYEHFGHADVRCGNILGARCCTEAYELNCENGRNGHVKSNTPLKAITVQVLNQNNQIIEEKTLRNPPGELGDYYYRDDVNKHPWINQRMPNVSRIHTIKVKGENGFTLLITLKCMMTGCK